MITATCSTEVIHLVSGICGFLSIGFVLLLPTPLRIFPFFSYCISEPSISTSLHCSTKVQPCKILASEGCINENGENSLVYRVSIMFAIELLGKKSNGGSGKDAGEAIGKKWGAEGPGDRGKTLI